VALTIDLGLAVLLRCAVDGGAARWLGITRREAGGAWHGLRVALHAALAAADAPAADPTARLQRARQGDVRAFEMLVVKYQRRIERLIGRMVRDVDLVADIAQETFIRAYRALPQFRGESAFYTWLYRIAVNSAKKAMAELQRDPLVLERAGGGDEDEEPSRAENALSDGETPDAVLASREIAAAVNSAIEALSEDLRQAITLREIEGLSYEEIAEVMNCPIGTVRSRIFRAREAIAQRLRPLLDTRDGERW
jgi:RNA polymerase sigma-70 factor (ECF subfamily)